jgi:hypothetical protein
MRHLLLSVFPALLLASCAGYQLGGVKPKSLAKVKNISVPMFSNETQHPRAEAIATSAVASTLVQDGTYKLTSSDKADAILNGSVRSIEYSSIRGSRLDTLLPEELHNTITVTWTLRDAKDATKVLATGASIGTSQLFVDSNLQTARNNALPDAMERMAVRLVSTLANGY